MAIQDKFDAALALIKEHNDVIGGPEKPGYVDPDKFISCIKAAGGTTEDRLKNFNYEEITPCMPKTDGITPLALVKDIAKIFRGKDAVVKEENRPISGKKADRMTRRELVECYDPTESDNAVGKRLREISKGEKFIVFSTGRTVDVDTTVKLLDEIKNNFPGRTDITVGEEIKPTYAVGEVPDNYVEENPLYRNRPLRPDGTCDQTGRSWAGIPLRTRQLIRVAMDIRLVDVNLELAHQIMDIALADDGFNKLRLRYRQAAVKFDEYDKEGTLPKLRLILGNKAASGGGPFDNGKIVGFVRR